MEDNFDSRDEYLDSFKLLGKMDETWNRICELGAEFGTHDELEDFNMTFSGCTTLSFPGYKIKIPKGMVIEKDAGTDFHAYLPGTPDDRLLIRHVTTFTADNINDTDNNIADIMNYTIENTLSLGGYNDRTIYNIETTNSHGRYLFSAGNVFLYMIGHNCFVIYRILANCSTARMHEIVRFIASGIEPNNGSTNVQNEKNNVNVNNSEKYDLNTLTTYSKAVEIMNNAKTENEFREASMLFGKIPQYMDSKELGRQCNVNAGNAKRDKLLNSALELIKEADKQSHDTDDYYMDAIEVLQNISGWKNADLLIKECKSKILQLGIDKMTETEDYHPTCDDYMHAVWIFEDIAGWKNADSLRSECKNKVLQLGIDKMTETEDYHPTCDDYMAAIEIFEDIAEWKNADSLIDDCKRKIKEKEELHVFEKKRKIKKKITTIITLIFAIIILTLLWKNLIYPPIRYNRAVGFMESEKYEEAVTIFESMGTYKDSEDRIDKCYSMICGEEKWNEIKAIKIGRIYKFGKYEQDGDVFNGKEEIEWKVLDKKGTKILVVSWYILDEKQYKHSYQATETTWEKSSIRKWLNNRFLKYAFSADEIAMIQTVKVPADKNPQYDTSPGNATQDKVFLLSMSEVEKYFGSSSHMEALKTTCVAGHDAYESSGEWWLRTPGFEQYNAVTVYRDSGIDEMGEHTHNYLGVRPAMWIDLNS